MAERAATAPISRSLAPLRDVVASLSQAAGGALPTGSERRRLTRRVRAAGMAAVPSLLRALVSPVESEGRLAAWLLARLGGPRIVERLTQLLEDPRTPDEARPRATALLADLAGSLRVPIPSPLAEKLLQGTACDFLRSLESDTEVRLAVELVARDVPEDEVIPFVSEMARHGGPLALPLLDALLDAGRQEPETLSLIASLRADLQRELPGACEVRTPIAPRNNNKGAPPKSRPRPRRQSDRRRGFSHVERGEWAQAAPLLERALMDSPDDAEALGHLGVCLLHLGDPEGSLVRLERAVALAPDEALSHWNVAAAARAAGRSCKSYMALSRYLTVEDDVDGARQRRRDARSFVRGYEDLFRSMYPKVPLTDLLRGEDLFEHAFAALSVGRYEEARRGLMRVIELVPEHHPSWGNLGAAEMALGNLDEATRCFHRALELRPDYDVARDNLRLIETRH